MTNILVNAFDCLVTPWNIVWILTDHMYGMMLTVVSLDRLIMVYAPLQYIGYGKSYALSLLAATHLPYLTAILYFFVKLSNDDNLPHNKPNICFTEWIYSPAYSHILNLQNSFFAALSGVLYIGVLILYKKSQASVAPSLSNAEIKREIKKQRRMTLTLGFSCIFTYVFYVLPVLLRSIYAPLQYIGYGKSLI